jgi:hypothetical protein
LIGEGDFPVTVNLYEALLILRDPYIERIILNQEDKEERAQQIEFMANIYSKAICVII